MDVRALNDLISWDRKFEQSNGLQNIQHAEAKEYLAKYVNRGIMTNHYFYIVDFIKDGNSKRLGKLAWKIEASGSFRGLFTIHDEALNVFKKLLPNPEDECVYLEEAIAKLHVPDFLPKDFWKHGMEMVERYFEKN